jgi:hypothetical protein
MSDQNVTVSKDELSIARIDALTTRFQFFNGWLSLKERDDTVAALKRLRELERGEYICKSCGLRKDGEVDEKPNF